MLIDIHAHAFPDQLAAGAIASLSQRANILAFTNGRIDDTIAKMQSWGVDRFAILNIAATEHQMEKVNLFARAINSEKIIAFGSVYPLSNRSFLELDKLEASGIKGIKFHNEYQNYAVDDERAYPVYEYALKKGFVLVFHGGVDIGFTTPLKAPVEGIARVAREFGGERMIAAHMGGYQCYKKAMELLPQTGISIDTSFVAGRILPETFMAMVRSFSVDKILFGSDCPWQSAGITKEYIESLPLSLLEKRKIYFGNATKLLDL